MSGVVGDLSPKQEEALNKFRERVKDILKPHHDDYFLLRWLRARNFNVDHAETMLRKSMQWRKEMGTDNFLKEYDPPEVFKKYYPGGLIGFDKEGCPVRVLPFGVMDIEGCVNALRLTDCIKNVTLLLEEDIRAMEEQTAKLGRVIEKHIYIMDMAELSMRTVLNKKVTTMMYHILKTYEENYPERLKRAYLINVPPAFYVLFNMLKPFMSEDMIKKYLIFETDGYQKALLESIDPEVLPAYLGGTRRDPDGDIRCRSVVKPGGKIPPYYFMKNVRDRFCDLPDVVTKTVNKKGKVPVDLHVPSADTVVELEILATDYDIAFGVSYRPQKDSAPDDRLEEVLPITRVQCHELPEKLTFSCPKPGTYVLHFDNSYSWVRQKEVKYRVGMHSPPESPEIRTVM